VDNPSEALTRVAPYDPADGIRRRCRRCLQFLLDDGTTGARPTWWLCPPCHAKLLPATRRVAGRRAAVHPVTAVPGDQAAADAARS
jgi:hypothetical protein